jgi:hypothetical protein
VHVGIVVLLLLLLLLLVRVVVVVAVAIVERMVREEAVVALRASLTLCRGQLKTDGTRAETIFRLSAKLTSAFKLAGASVQLTTGSRGVRISNTPCSEIV